MHVLTVHGKGFLWHQIRHMVAVLQFIGRGVESPDVIPRLLDASIARPRPAYEMASELPLVLYECEFKDVDFIYDTEVIHRINKTLLEQYCRLATKTELTLALLGQLDKVPLKTKQGDDTTWGELRVSENAPVDKKRNHFPIAK